MNRLLSTLLFLAVSGSLMAQQPMQPNSSVKAGDQAPELAFPNPEGDTISLKELNKGRYVLIDFWASWCGPCRRANPALVQFHEEYKDRKFKGAKKGFAILSVSLDRNKEAWLKAIEADKLSWPYHMSDLKSWASDAAAAYGVRQIPQVFLVGPDGVVIGNYFFSAEAEKVLKELALPEKKKGSGFLFFKRKS